MKLLQRIPHTLRLCVLALALALFGFIPGLGTPGAVVIIVCDPILWLLRDAIAYPGIPETQAIWSAAILATLLWPWSIPAGYVLGFKLLSRQGSWVRVTTVLGTIFIWCTAVTYVTLKLVE